MTESQITQLANAPEPEDLTGRLSNWLSRQPQLQCQQVVTQYAQSEAESKCGASMQLRICDTCRQPYCPKHIADHDCPEKL